MKFVNCPNTSRGACRLVKIYSTYHEGDTCSSIIRHVNAVLYMLSW